MTNTKDRFFQANIGPYPGQVGKVARRHDWGGKDLRFAGGQVLTFADDDPSTGSELALSLSKGQVLRPIQDAGMPSLQRYVELMVCTSHGGDSGSWYTTDVLIPAGTPEERIEEAARDAFSEAYGGDELIASLHVYHIPELGEAICAACAWTGDLMECSPTVWAKMPAGDDFPVGCCPDCDGPCYRSSAAKVKTLFVRHRTESGEIEIYLNIFEHAPGLDVVAAAYAAASEYLATPEGKAYNASIRGDFNWGDATAEVPDGIWARHGLRLLDWADANSPLVLVDQDERLAKDANDVKA